MALHHHPLIDRHLGGDDDTSPSVPEQPLRFAAARRWLSIRLLRSRRRSLRTLINRIQRDTASDIAHLVVLREEANRVAFYLRLYERQDAPAKPATPAAAAPAPAQTPAPAPALITEAQAQAYHDAAKRDPVWDHPALYLAAAVLAVLASALWPMGCAG
jgi:hypothetical protein